jgi:hypothetical protein
MGNNNVRFHCLDQPMYDSASLVDPTFDPDLAKGMLVLAGSFVGGIDHISGTEM